jgi:glycosyltransferase involved in cell wall biosynthesis
MSELSPDRVKIAFALPSFSAGGAERVLITLMNDINRKKFSPCLICLNQGGPLRSLVADDVPVHADHNFSRVVFAIPYLIKMLWIIKPDVVLSTMAHMNFAVLLASPFLPRRTKIIVREAITPSFLLNTYKRGWLVKILYKMLYPRAWKVICPAQCIIDEFEHCVQMQTRNFSLLYNPVNIEKIRAHVPTELPREPTHFICAGRLHHQKGFDRLIECLPRLNNKNWHLTILGEGDERTILQQLVDQHELAEHVTLAGFSSTPWPQIAQADCFLLPSRHEGLPNVALEALCVGTPVISMREAGGIGEIAALASPGSVTLCNNMDDFLTAMERVNPLPRDKQRESLLPQTFHPETVEECFMELLDQAA